MCVVPLQIINDTIPLTVLYRITYKSVWSNAAEICARAMGQYIEGAKAGKKKSLSYTTAFHAHIKAAATKKD